MDGNQELAGIGSANLAAGLFSGFPVSTSGSRTAVAFQSGAKTQLTGLVAAALVLAMLLFVPGLVQDMPQPVLAAVVIAASISLFDVAELRRLFRVRKTEFALAVACALGVMFVGVLEGIVVAVVLSVVYIFKRAWAPYSAVLGKDPGRPRLARHPALPGRGAGPGAAHRPLVGAALLRQREPVPRPDPRAGEGRRRAPPQWVLVAAEPITDIDTTAGAMLADLDLELNAAGIHLAFAELQSSVRDTIVRYGLLETIDEGRFYRSVPEAVEALGREVGGRETGLARIPPPRTAVLRPGRRALGIARRTGYRDPASLADGGSRCGVAFPVRSSRAAGRQPGSSSPSCWPDAGGRRRPPRPRPRGRPAHRARRRSRPAPSRAGPIPLIIDNDMSFDDVMAIAYLTTQPAVEILAVTVTGTGIAHCGPGARNARSLLNELQAPAVPTACGSEEPVAGGKVFPEEWRTGADGLWGLKVAGVPGTPKGTAVELLAEVIGGSDRPVTVLATGPMTNLAQALAADPTLADGIARIVIMGGAVDVDGNATVDGSPAPAEWNFAADPAAADAVFASGIPITLVPLDATNDVKITRAFADGLHADASAGPANLVDELLLRTPMSIDVDYFWDALAAAMLVEPAVVTTEEARIAVTTEGPEAGRTIRSDGGTAMTLATAADRAAFETAFLAGLRAGGPRRTPSR